MPVPKFDRKFVKLIAEEAKVPEEAVWINLPKVADEKVQVIFWTTKMSNKQLTRLAGMNAGNGYSHRQKVAHFLRGCNAEGWLTKADPRDAQPHELHPLAGATDWCNCGEKLMTPQEAHAGKCEGCCPQ
jgi:hypothetical protein